jgi:lipopolysaccharide transport system ATP-binding protein
MSDDVLIRAEGVSKKFCRSLKRSLWYGMKDTLADLLGRSGTSRDLRDDEFWAVNDVSFELRRGECLGLIGRNGAGKTTLLRILSGLIKPDQGRIEIRGRVGALIALGAGFNPILTGRENIYVNGSILGLSKKEIDAKYEEIVDFADIGEFIHAPVQSYSSGMQVRLGFAIATALRPDVLLLDEVLAVGDAAFRTKCFNRIGKILSSAAVIFVSHNEAQIYRICNQALLLANGRVVTQDSPERVLASYRLGDGHVRAESSKVVDDRLVSVSLQADSTKKKYGGELNLTAFFEVVAECRIGAVLVHFWRNGEFVANGDLMLSSEDAFVLLPGKSEMRVNLRPLHLQAGKYALTFAVFDESRKGTILHWLHFLELEIEGPIGAGPPFLLPMSVVLRSGLAYEREMSSAKSFAAHDRFLL